MLRKTDRAFLQELSDFIYMGRPVAAIALYNSGVDKHATASTLHKYVELLPDHKIEEEIVERRTDRSIQATVVAKILAEIMGGVEDLGALCFAIKHRGEKSIFKTYALSTSEPGTFFSEFMSKADSFSDLGKVLKIPRLDKIKQKLVNNPELYNAIMIRYKQVLGQIKSAAQIYTMQGVKGINLPKPDDDVVYVVYYTEEPNSIPDKKGILVKTFYKIKHRFLVFEDINTLTKALEEEKNAIGLKIKITYISINPEAVDEMLRVTMGIGNCMAQLVWILKILENNGFDL